MPPAQSHGARSVTGVPAPVRSLLDYYRSDDGRLFLKCQARWLAGALALLAMLALTDLDREIARRFFDVDGGTFPLTNDWWLKTALHDAVRTAAALAGLAVLAVTAAAWLVPRLRAVRSGRQELAFVAVAAFGSAALVAAVKHYSGHACPWDVVEFGGPAPYRPLLTPHEGLPPIEGCVPAAHPLVGYAWLCVAFALYPRAPRAARIAAWAALGIGTAAGAVQVMRGAHFVSHVLWTAWAVWAIDLAVLALCRLGGTRPLRRARKPSACSPRA